MAHNDHGSTHFVYFCPVRQKYAICVVNSGFYFAGPEWVDKGQYECTDNSGSGVNPIHAKSTTELYAEGEEMLSHGEDFCPFVGGVGNKEAWERVDEAGLSGKVMYKFPLGNHDRWCPTFDIYGPVTPELYAFWEQVCDIYYNKPGTHRISARAAKARHAKMERARRRRDKKRGWSMQWVDGELTKVPYSTPTEQALKEA